VGAVILRWNRLRNTANSLPSSLKSFGSLKASTSAATSNARSKNARAWRQSSKNPLRSLECAPRGGQADRFGSLQKGGQYWAPIDKPDGPFTAVTRARIPLRTPLISKCYASPAERSRRKRIGRRRSRSYRPDRGNATHLWSPSFRNQGSQIEMTDRFESDSPARLLRRARPRLERDLMVPAFVPECSAASR